MEVKYQHDFVRRYLAQRRAEGKTEGRLELIFEQLATRFGPLPDSIQTLVRSASAAQQYAVARRMLTAETLEETLSVLDT